jgi:hypothetical protein
LFLPALYHVLPAVIFFYKLVHIQCIGLIKSFLNTFCWLVAEPGVGTEDKQVLTVEKVDFLVSENTKAHHTEEYDITEDKVNPQLVVRRGQAFNIQVTFSKPYDVDKDDLRLVFSVGKR